MSGSTKVRSWWTPPRWYRVAVAMVWLAIILGGLLHDGHPSAIAAVAAGVGWVLAERARGAP